LSQSQHRQPQFNGHSDSQIVEPVPSTSTVNHSASDQALIQQKKKLKFQIENMGNVMKCRTDAVNRYISPLEDQISPVKEFLQEYNEGANNLHKLQRRKMELEDK